MKTNEGTTEHLNEFDLDDTEAETPRSLRSKAASWLRGIPQFLSFPWWWEDSSFFGSAYIATEWESTWSPPAGAPWFIGHWYEDDSHYLALFGGRIRAIYESPAALRRLRARSMGNGSLASE